MEITAQMMPALDALAEKIGIVIDWSQKNVIPYVMDLCHRIINFEIYSSIFWMVLGLLAIIAPLIIICIYVKNEKAQYGDSYYFFDGDDMEITLFFAALVGATIGIIIIALQAHDIITALTIPEKIILNWISSAA